MQPQKTMSDAAYSPTTEDKCVGIIPGFSWKFQKKVFHALAEGICTDFGILIDDFKRLGHIKIHDDDEFILEQREFQLKNLCECFLDESYYMLNAIKHVLHRDKIDHPYKECEDLDKVFLPFVEHAADKLEEIKKKQKEPPSTPSPPPSPPPTEIPKTPPPSPEDWVFVNPKKKKIKKKNKQLMPSLTSDEIIAKYRALANPHNEAISTLCAYLLTLIDKRYREYRTNKANMNAFLLGVHDKSEKPINIINPTHSFASIRKNIGEFTGIL